MKKGITVSSLVIAITIMLILVSTATVVGVRSIKTASYEEFISEILRVSDDVNDYYLRNDGLPISDTQIEIISKAGLSASLKKEILSNGDEYNNLYVVDMNKLKSESVKIGYGTISNLDVFLVAENSNNVYYYKGIVYKGVTYHGVQI